MNRNKDIKIIKKKYRDNMTDAQKQKNREVNKRYRDNMTDEQKQSLRDYQQKNIGII